MRVMARLVQNVLVMGSYMKLVLQVLLVKMHVQLITGLVIKISVVNAMEHVCNVLLVALVVVQNV
jgi:hypothetical protein